jgi:F-type H+-transporting ATPase subunit a
VTPFLAVDVQYGGNFDGALDDINALFQMPPIFEFGIGGLDLSINRTILIIWLATAAAFLLFRAAFSDARIVPGKLQSACEMVIDFVRNIALDIIGPKGVKFVPLLTTFFVFIFAMNLMKITPGIMLPPTSRMAVTGFLALTAWVVYVSVGIKTHGFLGYIKEVSIPPGTPKAILPILAVIEFVSNLILRPFALAIRLFANMVAGHILVVITLVTVHVFLYPRPGLPVGILALGISPLVFGFELFIIGLQAYIFTLLTAVYISSSLESH